MTSPDFLHFPVDRLTIVDRKASMRSVFAGGAGSQPVFVVRDDKHDHPIWAADVIGRAFSNARTADDVARIRASLRTLYQSTRPVLDALDDEEFWPGRPRIVELEHREYLMFHPAVRAATKYLQTFATVSLCASGKHVRGPFDGATCPTGLAWGADEPI